MLTMTEAVFVRKASGLIRQVGLMNTIFFNIGNSAPLQSIGAFWPIVIMFASGGNYLLGIAIGAIAAMLINSIYAHGSFYGFGIRSRLVRDKRIEQEEFEYGSDLVDHLVDSTLKLLQSGRAIGVVKRVTTAAIDGWVIKRDGDDRNVLHANDKRILSSLMAVGQVFSYTRAFGEAYAFNLLSRLASAYRRYVERLRKVTK